MRGPQGVTEMAEEVAVLELCKKLGYTFEDPQRLEQALRHASYVNERPEEGLQDNERLEFLGDTVLDLAISHLLMERYPEAPEGELSRYRAMIVDETGLSSVARDLELGRYLLLGKGESQSAGREKPSILADGMEALLGALYLDAGFERTLEVVRRLFGPLVERVGSSGMISDYKSRLQEHTQKVHRCLPRYILVEESGPAHDRRFKVELWLNGMPVAEGFGKSKKEAEQTAAKKAYLRLAGKEGR